MDRLGGRTGCVRTVYREGYGRIWIVEFVPQPYPDPFLGPSVLPLHNLCPQPQDLVTLPVTTSGPLPWSYPSTLYDLQSPSLRTSVYF